MEPVKAIGIDLGTTYTCAAVVVDGEPQVLRSREGYTTIPSVVGFDDQGQPLVGQRAVGRMTLHPTATIYGAKRLLGRAYDSKVKRLFQDHFRYALVPGDDGLIAAQIDGHKVPLVEASTLILAEIKRAAESTLGYEVERAVITVPAYYSENQRAMVRQAAQAANLEVVRLLSEPTAAALCYGRHGRKRELVLVYDLGGGTFDATLLQIDDGSFTVLAVDGDSFLGGLDFDIMCLELITRQVGVNRGRSLELDPIGWERLRAAAQQAKHQLSERDRTTVEVPNFRTSGETFDLSATLSRKDFERAAAPLIDRTLRIVERMLQRVGAAVSDVQQVLLVGGQTRMPVVRQLLQKMFGRKPAQNVHPDEVVALGAAIAAASGGQGSQLDLHDVVSLPIGIANGDGDFVEVIPRWSPIPSEGRAELTLPRKQTEIRVGVFQGEHQRADQNDYLGSVVVDALLVLDREVKCRLALRLDEAGILKVVARAGSQKRVLKLVTLDAPEDVLAQAGKERLQVAAGAKALGYGVQSGSARPAKSPGGGWLSRLFGRKS